MLNILQCSSKKLAESLNEQRERYPKKSGLSEAQILIDPNGKTGYARVPKT